MISPEESAAGTKLLLDLKNLVTDTRKLVETSPVSAFGKNAAEVAVLITAWILLAKNMGMTREQIHTVLDNVWDNFQ